MVKFSLLGLIPLLIAGSALAQSASTDSLNTACGVDVGQGRIDLVHVGTCEKIKANVPGYALNSVIRDGVEYTISLRKWGPFTVATGTMPPRLFQSEIEKGMIMKTDPEGDAKASGSIFSAAKIKRMEQIYETLEQRVRAEHCRKLRIQRAHLFY